MREMCSRPTIASDKEVVPTDVRSKHDIAKAHTPWDVLALTPADAPGKTAAEEEADDPVVMQELQQPRSRSYKIPTAGGGLFTLPLLCLGIGLIACCVLIPAADENRRLAYEREKLRIDLEQINKQTELNDEFLKKVADDPTLAERLAQRQMKMVREGNSVLELAGHSNHDMSPFELVTLPPPPEMAPYRPVGGKLSTICRNPRSQLYLMGTGLMLVAVGLVMGSSPASES
jgi:hypothetical protein